MKVSIGYNIQKGPWGGGNQFAKALATALTTRGDSVRFDLTDRDIDIIILTDPRERSPSVSFGAGSVLRYLNERNPNALVIHRINECDERKGTRHMNRLLTMANYCADYTIFIATWLSELPVWRRETPYSVILNGADGRVFKPGSHIRWNGYGPIKLVTHHWGGNRMKGFDIYEALDKMLDQSEWRNRIEFTYIGNLPAGFSFSNSRYLMPLQGEALARELASHHVYVTASLYEPAGMHHIEGAMCGLPLLYRRSGALPEYCHGFGIGFDGIDFTNAMQRMIFDYPHYAQRMAVYPHTADKMCAEYISLFSSIVAQKDIILKQRSRNRNRWLSLRSQLPF